MLIFICYVWLFYFFRQLVICVTVGNGFMLNVNKTYSNLCSENENNEFCCIVGTTEFSNRRLKTMTLNACRMYARTFNTRVHVYLNYTRFNTDSIKTCLFLFLNTR